LAAGDGMPATTTAEIEAAKNRHARKDTGKHAYTATDRGTDIHTDRNVVRAHG